MNKIMTVDFRGTEIFGFQIGGLVFVALKPIVKAMGLEWSAQFRRIKRDPILSEDVAMMAMPSSSGKQEFTCLQLDLLHGWLFTIDSNRVREQVRDKVLLYQRECYEVLHRHFSPHSEKVIQQQQESEGARVRMVTEARHTFGYVVAQQLWKKLNLPDVPAMAHLPAQMRLDLGDSAAA